MTLKLSLLNSLKKYLFFRNNTKTRARLRSRSFSFFIFNIIDVILSTIMQEQIKSLLKPAMMAKDSVRVGTIRMLLAAFTNELVATGHPPTDPLSDDDCMKVIKKLSKQRKDSIEQYIAGGRPELADDERAELAIIEEFLPAQMTEEEIESKVKAKLAESPLDPTKKGQFVGIMMKELGSTADGAIVKAVIDRLTS